MFVVDGYQHWTVTANGGDEFALESDNCAGSESVSTIGIIGELYMLVRPLSL